MKVYVSVASFGSYDYSEKVILYAGLDYDKAVQICKDYDFPIKEQEFAWVEIWDDGVLIIEKYIRD